MKKQRKSIEEMLTKHVDSTFGEAKPVALRSGQVAARSRNSRVKSTLYLHPLVHRKIEEIAFERRVHLNQLYMEAIDLFLREAGERSIAEITWQEDKAYWPKRRRCRCKLLRPRRPTDCCRPALTPPLASKVA